MELKFAPFCSSRDAFSDDITQLSGTACLALVIRYMLDCAVLYFFQGIQADNV